MKYVIRIAGVLAIVVALYILIGEQLVGTSGTAFVNAELVRARAPLSGTVQLGSITPGARVAAGDTLGGITARATTTGTVEGLTERLRLAQARAEALSEVSLDTAGSTGERSIAEAEARALGAVLDQAQLEQNRRLSASITAPAAGFVWSTEANNGEYIVEGDTLVSIADCSSAFILASVDERLYNRLSTGDVAQFRLHDGPPIEASVALLGGTGPQSLYETLAIAPGSAITDGYAVMLSAPGLASGQACLLGRTGRVVFSEGPLSFLRDLWDGGGR